MVVGGREGKGEVWREEGERRSRDRGENSFPEHMGTCDSLTAYSKHIAVLFGAQSCPTLCNPID